MNKREQKICNYFLILQLTKYNRITAKNLFMKYIHLLDKPFQDCIFDFSYDDKKILLKYSDEMISNSYSVLNNNLNGEILYVEDDTYPQKFRNIENFPVCIFYKGNIELLNYKSISVVGTREPSKVAIENSKRLSKFLMSNSIVIVSGLAKGVDGITHQFALDHDYNKLIGVVGTPISKYYPKENTHIQKYIEENGLIISEYANFENTLKWNFLRRNYIMSAVSDATIVVEAGDTSGTISQARSTLKNGRPILVPNNVFENPSNSWPRKFRSEYDKVYKFTNFEELKKLFITEIYNY